MTAIEERASFTVEPSTPTIGATLRGLDLRGGVDPATASALRGLLLEHEVLFLPGQDIGPEDHVAFASVFGTPRPVSAFFPSHDADDRIEVLEGRGESIGTDVWHTDLSWQERPAVATCLHARELPPLGGDTLWASMTAACAGLSPRQRALAADLLAEHTWEKSISGYVRQGDDGDERHRRQRATFPPVYHRVVQPHPVTGRDVVFVNDLFTTAILGLPRGEARALLDLLTDLPRVPEHQVRLRWEPDTVVVWDNRAVQHYAVTDYAPARRRLHRITIDDPDASFRAAPPPR